MNRLPSLFKKWPGRSRPVRPSSTWIIGPCQVITRDHKKINRTIDLAYRNVEELEDQIGQLLLANT